MSLRAAANQLGYLLGAGLGGVALAIGGFPALGPTLALLFASAALIHSGAGAHHAGLVREHDRLDAVA
jgi:hypothetical protein